MNVSTRTLLVAATALLGVLFLATSCSDDSSQSPEGTDAGLDAGSGDIVDTASDDARERDTHQDDASDTDRVDTPDTGFDVGRDTAEAAADRIAAEYVRILREFEVVDDSYAISNLHAYESFSEPFSETYLTYLIDISEPDDVRMSDYLVQPYEAGSRMQGVAFDGKVVVARARRLEDRPEQPDPRTVTATSYDITGGQFDELDSVDATLSDGRDCTLGDVVSNEQKIAIVCYEAIIELSMDDGGRLEVVGDVDRSDEMESLDGWGWRQYDLTPANHLLEVANGVRLWHTASTMPPPDPVGGEAPSPLVGAIEIDSWMSTRWSYDPAGQLVYLPGHAAGGFTPGDDMYVVNISDATAPVIVGQWNVSSEFGRHVVACNSSVVTGDRLYIACGNFDGEKGAIWTLDLTSTPTTLTPLTAIYEYELDGLASTQSDIAVHDGHLFYAFEDEVDFDAGQVQIRGVPLSTFEPAQN